MSCNRENVIWQSEDGTWNRGFYDYWSTSSPDDPDYDHEWDVEYDYDTFNWVSAGHPTLDAADRSWDGANPGGYTSYRPYAELGKEGREAIARLEDMAAVKYEEAAQRARESSGGSILFGGGRPTISSRQPGYWGYSGPAKTRSLAALQEQREQMVRAWVSHRLGGYANMLDPREKDLNAQIAERLKTATPAQIADYETRNAEHRDEMRTMLDRHRQRRREQARERSRYGFGGYDPQAGQRQRDLNAREQQVEEYIAKTDAAAAARIAARQPAPAKKSAAKPVAKKSTARPVAKESATKPTAKKTASGPQARQPKGVPTGGQFAASQRTEAAVSLAAPPAPPAPTPTVAEDFSTWGEDPWGA